MRAVAAECGISVGNLNYYYANKADLLADLLDIALQGYIADFDAILAESDPALPEVALEKVMRFIMADLGTRETTVFFPELWALANHDSDAAKRMHEMYKDYRRVYDQLIPKINPKLSPTEVRQVSLVVSASLEGHTMFLGYRKPWAKHRQHLCNIVVKGLLDLVRTVTSEDVANLHSV
jgi:AcrR family transcriptional regulator